MKILVIEDDAQHQEAARTQLAEHDVTIVTDSDSALKELCGGDMYTMDETAHGYDVVLTDLFIPCGRKGLSDTCIRKYVKRIDWNNNAADLGAEIMPLGLHLMLLAARNGAKYVGLLTDTNHHSHPASALLDYFKHSLTINDTRVIIENYDVFCRDDRSLKDWASMLGRLLGE